VAFTVVSDVAGINSTSHKSERNIPMKLPRFLTVVPKAVRISAFIVMMCGMLAGLVLAFFEPAFHNQLHYSSATSSAMLMGLCVSLFCGVIVPAWIIALGYIYGDARRRAMQPILWVLIALLCPHLLGFLLYFALRKPIPAICTNCGQQNPLNQRFCSSCGNPQPLSPPADVPPRPGSSGLDSITMD
jgi:hypothetical protein